MSFEVDFCEYLAHNSYQKFWRLFDLVEKVPKVENRFTIREIALAIGYTKPSVSNAIKELGIKPSKEGNTNILTQDQAEQIAAHFGKTLNSQDRKPKSKGKADVENQRYMSLLEDQLKAKDEQIKRLQETIEGQQRTIEKLTDANKALSGSIVAKDAQQLLEAKPIQEQQGQQEQPQEPKKKGFWARLFG